MDRSRTRMDRRYAWIVTALVMVAIGYATLTPLPEAASLPGGDKMHHLLAFAALALPLGWAYPRRAMLIVAGVSIYGGMIEIVQPYAGRQGEPGDLLADFLGAVLGTVVGCWLGRRRARRFMTA